MEISISQNDLKWLNNDHLIILKEYGLFNKYYSICCRQTDPDIKLYHFLIDLK